MQDEGAAGSHVLKSRLEELVKRWGRGEVSLKHIAGVSAQELHSIASQGYFFFLQGKLEPSRVIFEGLVALDPRNAYYHRALGAIYWRSNKVDQAMRQFDFAVKVAPKDISNLIGRAEVFISRKEFAKARADLESVLKLARTGQEALVDKARAMMSVLPSN